MCGCEDSVGCEVDEDSVEDGEDCDEGGDGDIACGDADSEINDTSIDISKRVFSSISRTRGRSG
jgi:hypothetical protein